MASTESHTSPSRHPGEEKEEYVGDMKVSFANVEIREYDRCLGNHPTSYHDGPSLSIDWNYKTLGVIRLEDYDNNKEKYNSQEEQGNNDTRHDDTKHNKNVEKDCVKGLDIVPGHIRTSIIQQHTNCTDEEIEKNIQESIKTDRQRKLCIENQDLEVLQLGLESMKRKFQRFSLRITNPSQLKQLKEEEKKITKSYPRDKKMAQ